MRKLSCPLADPVPPALIAFHDAFEPGNDLNRLCLSDQGCRLFRGYGESL
jgi:hypothetical protein